MSGYHRREFLANAGVLFAAAAVSRSALAALPEIYSQTSIESAPPLLPSSGRPYRPVVTLNGWSLPFRMRNGWKEFHLVAEPVEREFCPGLVLQLWGYNGQSPGPTIEVVEGDKVRIFVTNKLLLHTTIHWHGQRLPNGMDGVGGLNQPHINTGKTFVYEFVARRAGTFMYRPHTDESVQLAMGLMGFWVTHPRDAATMSVDRDFVFLASAYDLAPGTTVPRVDTKLDFNLWSWNNRVFPGIDPLVVRKGDRVRIRIGNLTTTNQPVHLHGHELVVAGTDGGWTAQGTRTPEVTVDIAVGQMRAIEFDATEPGDWAFHSQKSQHIRNALGHDGSAISASDQRNATGQVESPTAGSTKSQRSAAGSGAFGPVEMGGTFTTVKVRDGLARNDFRDPGHFRHPPGQVAYEWTGGSPHPSRAPTSHRSGAPMN